MAISTAEIEGVLESKQSRARYGLIDILYQLASLCDIFRDQLDPALSKHNAMKSLEFVA
jgi:hypothetical protein